jgi:hypothetical protein
MATETEQTDQQADVKLYSVQYPVSAYTFPHDACIRSVRFDDQFIHLELSDGRVLSVPLYWIPTLHNASAEDRGKYELNRTRTAVIWNPDHCAINDEVRVADYLQDRFCEQPRERHRADS